MELKDREIKIKKEIEEPFLNRFLFLQKIWIGFKKKK